jgi:hypothetical protein
MFVFYILSVTAVLSFFFFSFSASTMYEEALSWIDSEIANDLLADKSTLPKPANEYLPSTKRILKKPNRFLFETSEPGEIR